MAKQTGESVSVDFQFTPKNDRQREFVEVWPEHRVLIAEGPPGTGKTHTGLGMAIQSLLKSDRPRKCLQLCRPAWEVGGESHGYLPGTLDEKLGPWLAPFQDVAKECVSCKGDPWEALKAHLKRLNVEFEFVSAGMLRGRTVDGVLVVDEVQNCTYSQIKCALTRIGQHGRVVLCGDPSQADREVPAPIVRVVSQLKKARVPFGHVIYQKCDNMRHPLINQIDDALKG